MAQSSYVQAAGILACLSVLYFFCLAIYRLYLHPLAKFPGPKLAALTSWYETYYDVYLAGKFRNKIQELHTTYGSIVRISPNQVNIHDIDFYEEIYAPANRIRDREPGWEWMSGAAHSAFGSVSHDLHRRRRGALNSFFSKRAITDLDDMILSKVARLCQRLQDSMGNAVENVIKIDTAFTALTTDVINEYAFGKSWNYLDRHDFNQEWKDTMKKTFVSLLTFKSFPLVARIIDALPDAYVKMLDPTLGGWLAFVADVEAHVRKVLGETPAEKQQVGRRTIFHELRDSNLPQEEKTAKRLSSEGLTIVGAGTETTANAASITTYHLLKDPQRLSRLRAELKQLYSEPDKQVPLYALEHLPYLTAVLTEGIRLAGGAAVPHPRIAPNEALRYKDWVIPAGTVVSELDNLLHYDPDLFPDPESFVPERWLEMTPEARQKRSSIQFDTGPRNCLGQNLAWAELYRLFGELFSKFEMELVDTIFNDVKVEHYTSACISSLKSKGIRVRVTKVLRA